MHDYNKMPMYFDSLSLTEGIYRYTQSFPERESSALGDQLRRAAVSVPSNLAEACGRSTAKDTARMLSIAIGSIHEVDTQLRISMMLGYGNLEELQYRAVEVRKQLIGFRKYILKRSSPT